MVRNLKKLYYKTAIKRLVG